MPWKEMLDFFRSRGIKVPEGSEGEKQKPKNKKEQGRIILTSRGGPNMPKFQHCPQCGASAKRKNKTVGGAYYFHKKCDCGFFVGAKGEACTVTSAVNK